MHRATLQRCLTLHSITRRCYTTKQSPSDFLKKSVPAVLPSKVPRTLLLSKNFLASMLDRTLQVGEGKKVAEETGEEAVQKEEEDAQQLAGRRGQFVRQRIEAAIREDNTSELQEYLRLVKEEAIPLHSNLQYQMMRFYAAKRNTYQLERVVNDYRATVPKMEARVLELLVKIYSQTGEQQKLKNAIDELNSANEPTTEEEAVTRRELELKSRMDALINNGNLAGVLLLYKEMVEQDMDISPLLYASLLEACRKGKRLDLAQRWYEELKEFYPDQTKYPFSVVSTMMELYADHKQIHEMIDTLRLALTVPRAKHGVFQAGIKVLDERHTLPEDRRESILKKFRHFQAKQPLSFAVQKDVLSLLDGLMKHQQVMRDKNSQLLFALEYPRYNRPSQLILEPRDIRYERNTWDDTATDSRESMT